MEREEREAWSYEKSNKRKTTHFLKRFPPKTRKLSFMDLIYVHGLALYSIIVYIYGCYIMAFEGIIFLFFFVGSCVHKYRVSVSWSLLKTQTSYSYQNTYYHRIKIEIKFRDKVRRTIMLKHVIWKNAFFGL